MLATKEGITAVKYSFWILAATACIQLYIALISGSVALLADTIHNVADACTSLPLWAAFLLSHKKPSHRFTYGYGRVEDFAGMVIVLIIVLSAGAIAYKSIERLIHPEQITNISAIVVASILGFAGNEMVARYRIRIGKKIESAALVADGAHARADSYTSLAVLLSALGAWAGMPIVDSIVGIGIVIALCKVIYDASVQVFTRLLDGVDPTIIDKIATTLTQFQYMHSARNIRARWVGHHLHAEIDMTAASNYPIATCHNMTHKAEDLLKTVLPALTHIAIHVHPPNQHDHNSH